MRHEVLVWKAYLKPSAQCNGSMKVLKLYFDEYLNYYCQADGWKYSVWRLLVTQHYNMMLVDVFVITYDQLSTSQSRMNFFFPPHKIKRTTPPPSCLKPADLHLLTLRAQNWKCAVAAGKIRFGWKEIFTFQLQVLDTA